MDKNMEIFGRGLFIEYMGGRTDGDYKNRSASMPVVIKIHACLLKDVAGYSSVCQFNCNLYHFWSYLFKSQTPCCVAVLIAGVLLFFQMWQGRPEVFTPAIPQAGPV
jgi:hypothetical protein